MELFITDDKIVFKKSGAAYKLHISNSTVHAQAGFDPKQIESFNFNLNGIETRAAEEMILELKKAAAAAPLLKTNKYLATRKAPYDIAYSLLYPNFKLFVLNRIILEKLVKLFLEKFKIAAGTPLVLDLSFPFSLLFQSAFFKELNATIRIRKHTGAALGASHARNLYYHLHALARYPSVPRHKTGLHALLFIYDTSNDINLFLPFVKALGSEKNIKLSIVQISSGLQKSESQDAKLLKVHENINLYYFKDFKAPVKEKNTDFYAWAKKFEPHYSAFKKYGLNQNLEIYYSFAANAIKKLRPDVTLYDNTGEVGRVISDISRYYKVPCINVEYSLFTDDAIHMESNIRFSARACLGEASIDLWKKRNDPTPKHFPIGFLKLDCVKNSWYDKASFYNKQKLDPGRPTIFFASTWAGINDIYNAEKARIIQGLCAICEKHNWNLLIKKHPSERDLFANKAVREQGYKKAKVFEHKDVDLYEILSYCDVATTQFSGVSVEALYFKKPVLFINLSEENNWANLSIMKDEPYVCSLSDLHPVESKLMEWIDKRTLHEAAMQEGIRKYLFKNDGNASMRLLALIKNSKNEL